MSDKALICGALSATAVTREQLEQELEQLFREHYQMLYRTAYSMLDNLKKNAKGYLYRAAVNLFLDMIRSRKRQELTADVDERL
jgi:DNA-directed RNA polymerase specialized sigma24 family protein